MKKFNLFILLLISNLIQAQYGHKDGNRIGISGGVTQTSLMTSSFNTAPAYGWIVGLAVRGNYYNNWSASFGMQFTDSNFMIQTKAPNSSAIADSKVKLSAVQVRLLASYNVVKDHVSLDIGPVLQVNGELGIEDSSKSNVLTSAPSVKLEELSDISKVNGNLYLGATAGNRRVRLVVSYQYGFSNLLGNLNSNDDLIARHNNQKFTGNIGMLSGQLLFNL